MSFEQRQNLAFVFAQGGHAAADQHVDKTGSQIAVINIRLPQCLLIVDSVEQLGCFFAQVVFPPCLADAYVQVPVSFAVDFFDLKDRFEPSETG